jgi:hypothetical protein
LNVARIETSGRAGATISSPLLITEETAQEWTKTGTEDPAEMVKFLEENRHTPKLSVVAEKAMKPGWEKRIPDEFKK